jgi:Fic family protein
MDEEGRVRHSQAQDAEVVKDDVGKAKREAANSLRQADRVRDYVLQALDGRPFKLRPSTILDLNRCAIEGLDAYAGVWRPAGIEIGQSKHQPPDGHLVPELVEELCDYVNDNWTEQSGVHLASFVMWRLNWIHPFTDGNGRTSRATSYLVLCVREGMLLPGRETIPEQIVSNRMPYYEALEDADGKYAAESSFPPDIVAKMEELMGGMLAGQLHSAFDNAVGNNSQST